MSYPDPTEHQGENGGPFYTGSNNATTSSHDLTNADDLRLAAQLSSNMQPKTEDRRVETMHDAPEPEQNNADHQYSTQSMHQHLEEHGGMPDPTEGHGGPVEAYSLADHSQFSADDGSTPARKRSKVSRACDECRRKKIRCDATSESGDEQCSNCKRVGTNCQFSRVPMKRGPSKGYIKELADRLHVLEGAVQGSGVEAPFAPMQSTSRRASNDFAESSGLDGNQNRKRGYSSISNSFGGYQPNQSGQWSMDQGRSGSMQDTSYRSQFEPNGLAPLPSWKDTPDRQQLDASFQGEHAHLDRKVEWDGTLIDSYYASVQNVLPLLPHNKKVLASRLASCPQSLSQALLEALYATVRITSNAGSMYQDPHAIRRALSLVTTSSYEDPGTRFDLSNLVHLQTLLILAIEAGCHGPPGSRSQHGPSQSVLLGSAVGLAYSMKLHTVKAESLSFEIDSDSDVNLGRRAWWTLVILDKFHASSTASPQMIPDASAVLLPQDQALLGDATYDLARLSSILGHVAAVTIAPAELTAPGAVAAPIISSLLAGELERFRETLAPSLSTAANPVTFLTYWHLRLLMKYALAASEPTELIGPAMQIINILVSEPRPVSPLTHHFLVLATVTLLSLLESESTRAEAERGISSVLELHNYSSGWESSVRELINKKIGGGTTSHALTASQGLQHLADLATATDSGRTETFGGDIRPESSGGLIFAVDPSALLKTGFLSVLSG